MTTVLICVLGFFACLMPPLGVMAADLLFDDFHDDTAFWVSLLVSVALIALTIVLAITL